MNLRRSDQHRRRVLMDDSTNATTSDASPVKTKSSNADCDSNASGNTRVYTSGGRRRNQLRTTDLIPKRRWVVALLILGLIGCAAGLNWLHEIAGQSESILGTEGTAALSLDARSGIGTWFSTFLLILTSLASVQTFALRQHRCDDYRGHYRIWLFLAVIFLFASLNCVIDLNQIFTNAAQKLTGFEWLANGTWALVSIKLFLMSLLIGRILIEIRSCKAAVLTLVIVALAYGTNLTMEIESVDQTVRNEVPIANSNFAMAGHIFLFLTVLIFTRFVYLDAQGLIVRRERSDKTVEKKAKKTKPRKSTQSKPRDDSGESAEETATPKRTRSKPARKQDRKKEVAAETEDTAKTRSQPAKTKAKSTKTSESATAKKKTKSTRKSASVSADPEEELQDLLGGSSKAKSKSARKGSKRASQESDSDFEADLLDFEAEGDRRLSKSQRRKLRKQKRNQRRAA